jgi:hypothetical protein
MLRGTHGLSRLRIKSSERRQKSRKQRVRIFVPDCCKPVVKPNVIIFRVPITHFFHSSGVLSRLNHVYGTGCNVSRWQFQLQLLHRFYKYLNYTASCLRRERCSQRRLLFDSFLLLENTNHILTSCKKISGLIVNVKIRWTWCILKGKICASARRVKWFVSRLLFALASRLIN